MSSVALLATPGVAQAQVGELDQADSQIAAKKKPAKPGTKPRNLTKVAGAAPYWIQAPYLRKRSDGRLVLHASVYVDTYRRANEKRPRASKSMKDRLKFRVVVGKKGASTAKSPRQVAFLPRGEVLLRAERSYVVKRRGLQKLRYTLSKKASKKVRRWSHQARNYSTAFSVSHWKDTYQKSPKWSIKQIASADLVKGPISKRKTKKLIVQAKRHQLVARESAKKQLKRFDRKHKIAGTSAGLAWAGASPYYNDIYIDNYSPFIQQVNFNPDIQCMWTGANSTSTSVAQSEKVQAGSSVMFSYTSVSGTDSPWPGINGATSGMNANGSTNSTLSQDAVNAGTWAAQQLPANMIGAWNPEGAIAGLALTAVDFLGAFLYDLDESSTCSSQAGTYPELFSLGTTVVGFGYSSNATDPREASYPAVGTWNGGSTVPAGNQTQSTLPDDTYLASLSSVMGATTNANYYWNGGQPAYMVSNNAPSGTSNGGSAQFTGGLMQYVGPNPGYPGSSSKSGTMHIALSYLSGPDYQAGLVASGYPRLSIEGDWDPNDPNSTAQLTCDTTDMTFELSLPFAGSDGDPITVPLDQLTKDFVDVYYEIQFHGGVVGKDGSVTPSYWSGGSLNAPILSQGSQQTYQALPGFGGIVIKPTMAELSSQVSYNVPGQTPGAATAVDIPDYFGCTVIPVVNNINSSASSPNLSVNTSGSAYGTNWPMPGNHTGWPTSQFSAYDYQTNWSWQWPVNDLNVGWRGTPSVSWIASGIGDPGVTNLSFGSRQAMDVDRVPAFPTCSANTFDPLTLSHASGSVYSDQGQAVDLQSTGYSLVVEASGSSSNPWMLRLYNSYAQEVRWDGSDWAIEPTTGWGNLAPFSQSGQLYGADSNGVLYVSAGGYGTYLAYAFENELGGQVLDGDANPQITYTPSASDNTCSSGVAVYSGS